MPASPLGKTGNTKIKPIGQTGGQHFGTNESAKQKGRGQATSTQIVGK